MRRLLTVACLCAVIIASGGAARAQGQEKQAGPLIQLAILLDTSNSMDGLIDQAKSQLWTIVNEFATARKGGKSPDFHVALYEYGNNSIPAGKGYIRRVLHLTTDLDKVSEQLFALKTNGGSEFCGKVIKAAVEELHWRKSNETLKVIFIAGNEPFTQGDVDYRIACKAAIKKGIMVNTIFCGPYAKGVSGKWKDGAMLADGKYINIDQDRKVVHIDAPQDKKIAKLGTELNKTYVPYGRKGKESAARQKKQDSNAESTSRGSNVQRQVAKAQSQYTNTGWDLVDAVRQGKVKIEDVKEEDLPENMRKMTMDERKAHIEAKAKEREDLKKQINDLNEERNKHVAKKKRELSKSGEDTLDSAVIKAVREQAKKKNFKFKEEKEK